MQAPRLCSHNLMLRIRQKAVFLPNHTVLLLLPCCYTARCARRYRSRPSLIDAVLAWLASRRLGLDCCASLYSKVLSSERSVHYLLLATYMCSTYSSIGGHRPIPLSAIFNLSLPQTRFETASCKCLSRRAAANPLLLGTCCTKPVIFPRRKLGAQASAADGRGSCVVWTSETREGIANAVLNVDRMALLPGMMGYKYRTNSMRPLLGALVYLH